jgi:hypothetical protein
MASSAIPRLARITVAGGTGSIQIALGGEVIGYGIIPPAGATYDIEFTDADGFGLGAKTALTGNNTIRDTFQAHDFTTITISNASANGTYQVKVWFRE